MTKFNSIVAIAASVLLSSPAWAGALQPAAGQAPFFDDAPIVASAVQRQSVEAAAARHMPLAGEMRVQMRKAPASALTRAEVRDATQQAIAHGFHIGVGESS